MKIWNYVLIVAFLLGVSLFGFVSWLRQDTVLSTQAREKIRSDLFYDTNLKQHPYFLFLGINARDEIDSNQLGRYRYHREWANFLQDPMVEVSQIDEGLDASLQREGFDHQDRELLKEFQSVISNQKQLDLFLKQHSAQLHQLIQAEKIPLQRLQQLLLQKNYASLLMHPQAIYPNYSYVLDLQRLALVDRLLNQATLEGYQRQFQHVHQFTQNRLSVVEKMMMQNWMNQLIDILRMKQRMNAQPMMLESLTQNQLSLVSSLEHELAVQYAYLKQLPSSFPQGERASTWVFLPNRTFNKVAQNYQYYFDLSSLSYSELQKGFAQQGVIKPSQWAVKNYYGEKIAQIQPPSFEKYLVMTHILNNKILSFNAVNAEQLNVAELNRNKEGRYYYIQDAKLCIETPYPMDKISELNLKTDSCVAI